LIGFNGSLPSLRSILKSMGFRWREWNQTESYWLRKMMFRWNLSHSWQIFLVSDGRENVLFTWTNLTFFPLILWENHEAMTVQKGYAVRCQKERDWSWFMQGEKMVSCKIHC
jgi:hypothetical protein